LPAVRERMSANMDFAICFGSIGPFELEMGFGWVES